jgi:hypothetical protein
MKKEIWLLIILSAIIVVLAGVLVFLPQQEKPLTGIVVQVPAKNSQISPPLRITGYVNEDGWTGFEGQAGVVKLLDSNGTELGSAVLTASTDWMQPLVNFDTYLNFQSDKDQPGTLVFENENPSGLAQNDRQFSLPVNILKSSGETMKIKVYFNNSKMDPESSCNKVFAVERDITKIVAVGSAALWRLLTGPTEQEKSQGYFTSINQDVKLQELSIDKYGTATADFDEQLQAGVGGSCKVSAIRAQITETLKQFPTINNVIISINGRTEDILQP